MSFGDIAILYRVNSQAKDFSEVFKKSKIPYFVKLKLEDDEESEKLKNAKNNAVTLVSIHSSKGLEWNTVFIIGCAEGLIPFARSKTPEDIEEERRLFYVGITRAKEGFIFHILNQKLSEEEIFACALDF